MIVKLVMLRRVEKFPKCKRCKYHDQSTKPVGNRVGVDVGEQDIVAHNCISSKSPVQFLPPKNGSGESHLRLLVLTPVPHDTEQVLHDDHCPNCPLIGSFFASICEKIRKFPQNFWLTNKNFQLDMDLSCMLMFD